jgi:hypothetical protein
MGPDATRNQNYCAGEDQQQLNQPIVSHRGLELLNTEAEKPLLGST